MIGSEKVMDGDELGQPQKCLLYGELVGRGEEEGGGEGEGVGGRKLSHAPAWHP